MADMTKLNRILLSLVALGTVAAPAVVVDQPVDAALSDCKAGYILDSLDRRVGGVAYCTSYVRDPAFPNKVRLKLWCDPLGPDPAYLTYGPWVFGPAPADSEKYCPTNNYAVNSRYELG